MRTKGAIGKMKKIKLVDMAQIKSPSTTMKKISGGSPRIRSFNKSFFTRAAKKAF